MVVGYAVRQGPMIGPNRPLWVPYDSRSNIKWGVADLILALGSYGSRQSPRKPQK